MTIVLEYLRADTTNGDFGKKLDFIISGIKGKKYTEQECSPRYLSILFFGYNIFTFTDKQYKQMAELIIREKL